jgi:small subunit ribosomal protein S20
VATHRSALKAHRQSVRHREHNRQLRTALRHALKTIRAAIDAGDTDKGRAALRDIVSLIDRMTSKGVIHRNTAGRYKSRITRRLAGKSATA